LFIVEAGGTYSYHISFIGLIKYGVIWWSISGIRSNVVLRSNNAHKKSKAVPLHAMKRLGGEEV
jgi:hypothetical protein